LVIVMDDEKHFPFGKLSGAAGAQKVTEDGLTVRDPTPALIDSSSVLVEPAARAPPLMPAASATVAAATRPKPTHHERRLAELVFMLKAALRNPT
jgi:hypothetical protein